MEAFVARAVRANRGDLASQAGLVAGLLNSPQVERVHVSTHYPHHFPNENRVIPVTPPPLRGMLSHWQEQDLLSTKLPILWGGGVDLQDSGSKAKMSLVLLRINLLKRHGSPFVLAFQGVGPIKSSAGRILLRRIVSQLDWSIVRERTARDLLIQVGGLNPNKLELACDAALLLSKPDLDFGVRYLEKAGLRPEERIIGLNLRRWFHQRGRWLPAEAFSRLRPSESAQLNVPMIQLIDNVAATVRRLVADGITQVVLLPMYRRQPEPWEDDIALLETLRKKLPGNTKTVMVEEDIAPSSLISILSSLDLMIGVRLHSTILSHIAGTPSVHIAYEAKGIDHFAQMNLEPYVVDIEEISKPAGENALAASVDAAMKNSLDMRNHIEQRVSELRKAGQASLEVALDQVAKK